MIFFALAVMIFALDFFIKKYIEATREMNGEEELFGGRIRIRRFHNTGAMFSFLENRQKLVAGISGIFGVWVLTAYFLLLLKKGFIGLKLALTFLVGGAGSNVYDRFVRGYVVDYFSFSKKYKRLSNIIFNVSDFFIFLGAFLLLVFGNVKRTSKPAKDAA